MNSPEPDTPRPESADPTPTDELVELGQLMAGLPARDFEGLLDAFDTPFATPEESQRMIKIEIDAAIERLGLNHFEVFEMVREALPTLPSVYQEDVDEFTWDTCNRWLEEGLPVDDSIYISAFEVALGIRLADL